MAADAQLYVFDSTGLPKQPCTQLVGSFSTNVIVNMRKSYINNDKQLSIAFLFIDLHGAVSDCLDFSSRFMLLPVKDIPSPTTSKLFAVVASVNALSQGGLMCE